jgi:hypothetical protein
MNELVAVVLLCATVLPIAAQTKVLELKNRVSSNVAFDEFRDFALPTACDEQGRSYVKLVKPGPEMVGPLLRLSGKGVLEAEFDTTGALVNIYAVRPNGGVTMVRAEGAAKVVDNFGPDGKRESVIRLEPPPTPFFPNQIAVFRSGEILLAGPQYHPGYKGSTAVYDPTGHLVKQFVLDGDAEIERAIEVGDARYTHSPGGGNGPVSRSVAITGDDGYVYLMRATSPATVYVISSAGEVIRKIWVSAPTDGGLPSFGVRVVKNRLAVKFYGKCQNALRISSCEGAVYTVVDATTGQKLADYTAEKDLAGPIACYAPNPDRFYIFLMPRGQHRLEIVEAEPKGNQR